MPGEVLRGRLNHRMAGTDFRSDRCLLNWDSLRPFSASFLQACLATVSLPQLKAQTLHSLECF